jgi:hypothetical protein
MDKAHVFRIISRVAMWLAFLATAAITLVTGWYGKTPAVPTRGGAAAGLPQKTVMAVTLLAALAAVLTAGGSIAAQQAESVSTKAQARQRYLIDARNQIIQATSAQNVRAILDDLAVSLRQ